MVYYEPIKNVALFTGCGWELGKEDLNMFRIGAEYEKHILKKTLERLLCMILKANKMTALLMVLPLVDTFNYF